MTLCYWDSLGWYNGPGDTIAKTWDASGGASASGAVGRFGYGSYVILGSGSEMRKDVATADRHATFIAGVAMVNQVNAPSFYFKSPTEGARIGLVWDYTAEQISVYRYYPTTVLLGQTATHAVSRLVWHYIEMKAVLHSSAGSVEVRVDGTAVLNLTGLNTTQGGTSVFGSAAFGAYTMALADFYLCNGAGSAPENDFMGEISTLLLSPNAAGDVTQLTPSSGANYTTVDETNWVDITDYNSSATVGHYDLYNLASTGLSTATIFALRIHIWAMKNGTDPKSIAAMLKSAGTEVTTAYHVLASSTDLFRDEWVRNNPVTGTQWTLADIEALQIGAKVGS